MNEAVPQSAIPQPDDGTRQLLRTGLWILAVGGVAALLAATLGGGIGQHGPHNNTGWLLLILAMTCVPFGIMLTLLGVAKWLRNRRLASRSGAIGETKLSRSTRP